MRMREYQDKRSRHQLTSLCNTGEASTFTLSCLLPYNIHSAHNVGEFYPQAMDETGKLISGDISSRSPTSEDIREN